MSDLVGNPEDRFSRVEAHLCTVVCTRALFNHIQFCQTKLCVTLTLTKCLRYSTPYCMRGSRNFHERGSNENGNFWSQTRGGRTPKKSRNYLFLGKIIKFQGGGGGPDPRSPPLDPRMLLNLLSRRF